MLDRSALAANHSPSDLQQKRSPAEGQALGVPCKPYCLPTILDKRSLKHLSFQAFQQAFPKVCAGWGPPLGKGWCIQPASHSPCSPEPSANTAITLISKTKCPHPRGHALLVGHLSGWCFQCSSGPDTLRKWKSLSPVRLFVTPWTVARQAPLSMGILQARILEWVAMPSSRGSSQPRDRTQVPPPTLCRWILYQLSHKGSPVQILNTLKMHLSLVQILEGQFHFLQPQRKGEWNDTPWITSRCHLWDWVNSLKIESTLASHILEQLYEIW